MGTLKTQVSQSPTLEVHTQLNAWFNESNITCVYVIVKGMLYGVVRYTYLPASQRDADKMADPRWPPLCLHISAVL